MTMLEAEERAENSREMWLDYEAKWKDEVKQIPLGVKMSLQRVMIAHSDNPNLMEMTPSEIMELDNLSLKKETEEWEQVKKQVEKEKGITIDI